MIDAIVLAAGCSTRMPHENKLLMNVGDKYIIQRVIKEVSNSRVDNIIVVLGYQHERILNALSDYLNIGYIYNSAFQKGQMTSIQAAMSQLNQKSKAFMICLGDMPMIKSEDYNYIIQAYNEELKINKRPIIRPYYKNSIGHPVIFHNSYKEEILKNPSNQNCKAVIKKNNRFLKKVEVKSIDYFFDVDNDMDYNRLIRYTEKISKV